MLQTEIAHAIRAMDCILDGEIVVLAPDGRSKFYDLLFRREWPHFIAFDVLAIGSEDLRHRPLLERKRRLKRIIPPRSFTPASCITTTSRAVVSRCSMRFAARISKAWSRNGNVDGITPTARRRPG